MANENILPIYMTKNQLEVNIVTEVYRLIIVVVCANVESTDIEYFE